jgi:hypothetical protein
LMVHRTITGPTSATAILRLRMSGTSIESPGAVL